MRQKVILSSTRSTRVRSEPMCRASGCWDEKGLKLASRNYHCTVVSVCCTVISRRVVAEMIRAHGLITVELADADADAVTDTS